MSQCIPRNSFSQLLNQAEKQSREGDLCRTKTTGQIQLSAGLAWSSNKSQNIEVNKQNVLLIILQLKPTKVGLCITLLTLCSSEFLRKFSGLLTM